MSESKLKVWVPLICSGVVLSLYVAGAIWAVPAYRYQINPDGVSYISLAQKYQSGEFGPAINAYWSPLYSWLLVPLLVVGIPPLLATKVLAALIGIGTLAGVSRLAQSLALSALSRLCVCLTLIPIVLYLATRVITPDLLAATIVVFYLALLTKPTYLEGRFSGVMVGLLGALGYLAKAYVMWFFLLHFLTVSVLWVCSRKDSRYRIVASAATTLATFTIVAGAWCGLLSHKYHGFTVGSTAAYNRALDGPGSPGHPMHTLGFLAPPNATAISAWEDPTHLPVKSWNPLASRANLQFQWQRIYANIGDALTFLQWHSILALAILAAAVALAGSGVDPEPHRPVWLLMLAVVFYPLGYLLLHVEERFLFPMVILLLVLGCFFVDRRAGSWLAWIQKGICVVLVCVTFIWSPVQSLWQDRGVQQSTYDLSMQWAGKLPKGSKVASDSHWGETLYMAFYGGWSYFGETKPGATPADVYSDLDRHHIEFFCVWGNPQSYPFTKDWPTIPQSGTDGPQIYRVPQSDHAPH